MVERSRHRPYAISHQPLAMTPIHALSSFKRILTKLYGGHGPVYLNVSLSKRLAIDLTLPSNAVSRSREMRNAAFMIILSPIGLLMREATDTSRSCSRMSAT